MRVAISDDRSMCSIGLPQAEVNRQRYRRQQLGSAQAISRGARRRGWVHATILHLKLTPSMRTTRQAHAAMFDPRRSGRAWGTCLKFRDTLVRHQGSGPLVSGAGAKLRRFAPCAVGGRDPISGA